MFYATTIKKVTANGVEDIHGKILRFTGSLPWKEGDTVWTDGKFILGHVPIRGGAILSPEEVGIPVVADWILANGTTCGYFNRRGRWKKKRIAEDSWIVNANRTYRHDSSDILDAEIAITNGIEDGLYVARWADASSQKYILQDNQQVADGEIIVEKDGQRFTSLRLSELAATIENEAKQDLEDNCPVFNHEADRVSNSAELKLFHVDTNGKWTAIIKFECEVRRKFNWVDTSLYYKTDTIEYKHEVIPIPADSNFRDNVISNLANEIRARGVGYGFLLNDGESLEECLGRISLGVALVNFFYTYSRPCSIDMEYDHIGVIDGPTMVETPNSTEAYETLSRTLKFTSDSINNPEIVSGDKYRYISSILVKRASTEQKPLSVTEGYPKITVAKSDPVTEEEYLETYVLSHLGIGVVFHDKQVTSSVAFYDTLEYLYYKTRTGIPGVREKEGTGEFTFPLQDGYYQKAKEMPSELVSCAVYDSGGTLICGANGIIGVLSDRNNFMIAPLGRGSPQSYLIGRRNGELYRATDNQFTQIGDGLKNFRLRELKNMNKAKR